MLLIDASILMYAAGAEHACKAPSARLLARIANDEVEATINAEILQEILHWFRSIKRWSDGRRVYDLTREIFPHIIPITPEVTDHTRRQMDGNARIVARDALHAAVVLIEGLDGICSFDRGFDLIPGIRRVEPEA